MSTKLGMTWFDVDDDHLESIWKCSVAEKLSQVGDERFVELEGEALLLVRDKTKTIISLSGSNPLHFDSMKQISKTG